MTTEILQSNSQKCDRWGTLVNYPPFCDSYHWCLYLQRDILESKFYKYSIINWLPSTLLDFNNEILQYLQISQKLMICALRFILISNALLVLQSLTPLRNQVQSWQFHYTLHKMYSNMFLFPNQFLSPLITCLITDLMPCSRLNW